MKRFVLFFFLVIINKINLVSLCVCVSSKTKKNENFFFFFISKLKKNHKTQYKKTNVYEKKTEITN